MLFLLFVLLLAAGIGCFVLYDRTRVGEWCWSTGLALTVFATIAICVSLVVLGVAYIGVDGDIAANETRYETLVYQYENNVYDNDNDLGKRELIKDIQSWNEDLAKYKEIQDDFWIGIFVPNIYDQFEFINLSQN